MNCRIRERLTLGFESFTGGLSVEETFYPWDLTVQRFLKEGIGVNPYERDFRLLQPKGLDREAFLGNPWARSVMAYEGKLGFDPVLRLGLALPVIPVVRRALGKDFIESGGDWKALKAYAAKIEEQYFGDADLENVYGRYRKGHARGDFSVRVSLMGFFFAPRELLGIEKHLYAFYDAPELLHEINAYMLDFYTKQMVKLLKILPADVIYFSEDLSGKTGPMVSPEVFREFVGDYYRRLFPKLKEAGAGYLFVDTDGDFEKLIPHFIDAGVEGFLPMDVNAGMDIVKLRRSYPRLRFIGGYNKLAIAQGRSAIDAEFERVKPVVAQGGCIIGCDHQLPPEASLDNYRYYIRKLKEVSKRT